MNMQTTEQVPATSLPEFLERWEWYRALPAELRSLTLETAVERKAAAGEYIARAGEPSTHWYGLMHGILQMYVVGADGAETTLYCLREGEWGGEGSLLKKEMRQYHLRSLTSAHICLVPAKTFEKLRQSSIEFNHFLCDIMNARMGIFVGMLEASRLRGPETRVARALLMLTDSQGDDTQEILISQHELALISGLSRQRVNVALSLFNRLGLVHTEARKGCLVVYLSRLRNFAKEETQGLCDGRRSVSR
ncbi:Crp/Fnr family transcriptional regulator [Noviherbaspirillum saxi]|uniref:Crp/Fnr family transcriptional regulator n=1 Tax=Noviherbaspirillum saxi TaxID=2320863 RepID=A0A3A3FKB2_9BURK|nr:Crp/Fnr family transcriptional regulator [Noviherbaspirillum saxi]RJF95624.1 Crp/Fnr family transcriptional regulator [Noviherbaspirillum saxi]